VTAEPFPVIRMAEVAEDPGRARWLVQSLWTSSGAGVLGGQPKAGKTWLALDIALSVASGTPCLGAFPVPEPGPVLLYLAEDSAANARDRVSGLCQHRGVNLNEVDLMLLSTPLLRLDRSDHAQRLTATVANIRPRLLVLDPFVRVQSIDENSATEVSRLLSGLTDLKRAFHLAILLVHHVRKNGSGHPGQTLRGSSDLRAWGDSNLFLRSRGDRLQLSAEHRTAKAMDPVDLALVSAPNHGPHLELVSSEPSSPTNPTLANRVVDLLRASPEPMTRAAIRQNLKVNNQRLGDALLDLETSKTLTRNTQGWALAQPFRSQPLGSIRNGTAIDGNTSATSPLQPRTSS
jgi:hypothetical protein